jgi:hypothetical protein
VPGIGEQGHGAIPKACGHFHYYKGKVEEDPDLERPAMDIRGYVCMIVAVVVGHISCFWLKRQSVSQFTASSHLLARIVPGDRSEIYDAKGKNHTQ